MIRVEWSLPVKRCEVAPFSYGEIWLLRKETWDKENKLANSWPARLQLGSQNSLRKLTHPRAFLLFLSLKNFIAFTSATDHKNGKICNTTLASYSHLSTEHWIIMARRPLTVVVRLPDVSPASITSEKLHKPSTRFTVVLHYYTNTATPILRVRSVEKHNNCYCLLQQLHYTVVPTYLS